MKLRQHTYLLPLLLTERMNGYAVGCGVTTSRSALTAWSYKFHEQKQLLKEKKMQDDKKTPEPLLSSWFWEESKYFCNNIPF